MLTRCYVTISLLLVCSIGACSDGDRPCGSPLALGSYSMQFDDFSRSCLGSLESLLPSEFIIASGLKSFGSLGTWTTYLVDVVGCTADIQVRTDDSSNAAQLYVEGNGLVETEGGVRGEVKIQLRQLAPGSGKMFDPNSVEFMSLAPSCETTARATLIRLPDPPDAGAL
jgi:hypothetical protein